MFSFLQKLSEDLAKSNEDIQAIRAELSEGMPFPETFPENSRCFAYIFPSFTISSFLSFLQLYASAIP
jgi:hypothetical protein